MFDRLRVKAPTPTGVAVIYEERLVNGVLDLVRTGTHDLNAFVQTSRDGCLVYNLLDRFKQTGDPSIFDSRKGFYADAQKLPSSLAEAHNMMLSIDKRFASLPADLKAEFGNSSHKFAEAVLAGNVESVISDFSKKKAAPKEKEGDPV